MSNPLLTQDFVSGFTSMAGLTFIWCLIFFGFMPLLTDVFRDRLFCLRDELIDLVADGELKVSDEAYRKLRDFLNGSIQMAHRLSFSSLAMSQACSHGARPNPHPAALASTIAAVDGEVRTKLQRIHRTVYLYAAVHIVLRLVVNPLGWIILALSIAVAYRLPGKAEQAEAMYDREVLASARPA